MSRVDKQSIGSTTQALTEFPDSEDGVGSKHFGIEFGVVDPHLGDVGPGPLG